MNPDSASGSRVGEVVAFLATAVAFWLPALVMPVGVISMGVGIALLALSYVFLQQLLVDPRARTLVMIIWPTLIGGVLGWGAWLVWVGQFGVLTFLFVVPLALVYFRLLSVVPFACYQRYTGHDDFDVDEPLPSVTAMVPAYNEEAYIDRAIESLLSADYPEDKLEVIVVNDGSSDGTFEQAQSYAADDRLRVFDKQNGGKYSALNYGLSFASGDIIVTVDADCIVHADAVKQMIAPFQTDRSIGAVAGDVRLINSRGLVVRAQALEYSLGINLVRRMFDLFGEVPIVPGCLGAYRRSALDDVNNFDPDTLTEDYDLTIKILKAGYDVRASPAIVYTEVPDTWTSLYNQRLRWYRGNMMTQLKHASIFRDPDYGILHSITFPLRMISMTIGALTTVLILSTIVFAVAQGAFLTVVTIFVVFFAISMSMAFLGLQLKEEDIALTPYTLVLVTVYKVFNDAVMVKSLADVAFSSDLSWTSPTRIRQRAGDGAGD